MKRLNPKTGLPFKHGDIREDGFVFRQYRLSKPLNKNGTYQEYWCTHQQWVNNLAAQNNQELNRTSTKEKHIKRLMSHAKHRSKVQNINFNLTFKYLLKIACDVCPILQVNLSWSANGNGRSDLSPSLDKIDPEIGYIEGNVQWVSYKANAMKSNASFKELHQFADWVKSTIPNE
jgi:hypothetical protein